MQDKNISVSVRLRPPGQNESQNDMAWSWEDSEVWATSRRETRYQVDHIYPPESDTATIYRESFFPLISNVVAGFNATLLAYGQTSSGKTFTIQGGPTGGPGVIPLAVRDVFAAIAENTNREFLVRVSYMELYNENVNDLLEPESKNLPIHESQERGVHVSGLHEVIVMSAKEVHKWLRFGEKNKHLGGTLMNECSSRSHTVFRMVVESRETSAEPGKQIEDAVRVSTLTMVDLAGSERLNKTGSEGLRMREGTAINKSLLNLGIVIQQLATKASVVSYRDSKLTRILQPSLGGNALTCILCCMTPCTSHLEEGLNTLRFALRAKKVVNNAIVNEVLSDEALLKRQAKQIEELQRKLALRGKTDIAEEISQLRAELLRMEQEKELLSLNLETEKRKLRVATEWMLGVGSSTPGKKSSRDKRRDTWCPGRGLMDEGLRAARGDDEELARARKKSRTLMDIPEDQKQENLSTMPPTASRASHASTSSFPNSGSEPRESWNTNLIPEDAAGIEGTGTGDNSLALVERQQNDPSSDQLRHIHDELFLAMAELSQVKEEKDAILEHAKITMVAMERVLQEEDEMQSCINEQREWLRLFEEAEMCMENRIMWLEERNSHLTATLNNCHTETGDLKEEVLSKENRSDRPKSKQDMVPKKGDREGFLLRKELDRLKEALKAKEASLSAAVRQKNEFEVAKNSAERELRRLQSTKESLAKSMEKSESQLGRRVTGLSQELAKMKERALEAEAKHKTARQDLERQANDLNAARGECQSLQQELHLAEQKVASMEAHTVASRLAMKRMGDEVDDKADELLGQAEQHRQVLAQLGEVQAEAQRLVSSNEQLDAANATLQAKVDSLQLENMALQNALKEANAARIAAEEWELEAQKYKQWIQDTTRDLANTKVSVTTAEAHLHAAEATSQQERAHREEVLAEYGVLQKEYSSLYDDTLLFGNEINNALKAQEAIEAKLTALQNEKDLETKKLKEANEELLVLYTANTDLKAEVEALEASGRSAVSELETAKAASEAEMQDLQAAHKVLAEKLDAAEHSLAKAEEHVDDLQSKCELLDVEKVAAMKEVQEIKQEKAKLEIQLQSFHEELQIQTLAQTSMHQEILDLRKQKDGFAEEKRRTDETVASLERERASLTSQLQTLTSELESLQTKVGALSEGREAALNRAAGLEREVESARGELAGALAAKEEADRRIGTSEVEAKKLRADLSRAMGKNEGNEKRCEELEAEFKEVHDELMAAKKNLLRMGTRDRKMEAECHSLEDRLKAAEERAEASAVVCSQYEEKLHAVESSSRRMEQQLGAECERLGREGAELLAANQQIGPLREENERIIEECMDLRQKEAERNKTILEQKTAGARLNGQLAQAKAALEQLQEEVRNMRRNEKELQAVLHALKKDVKKCGWEPAKMDALLKQTREEYNVDYTKAKNERLEKERAQLKQEIKALRGQLAGVNASQG